MSKKMPFVHIVAGKQIIVNAIGSECKHVVVTPDKQTYIKHV
jgi:hypothetical protein